MKKYFKLLALAMAALVVFASCETDEVSTSDGNLWEGELAAAKYASDAVLYNINADGVQSVELTGSGLYFVTPSYSGGDYPPQDREPCIRFGRSAQRTIHKERFRHLCA